MKGKDRKCLDGVLSHLLIKAEVGVRRSDSGTRSLRVSVHVESALSLTLPNLLAVSTAESIFCHSSLPLLGGVRCIHSQIIQFTHSQAILIDRPQSRLLFGNLSGWILRRKILLPSSPRTWKYLSCLHFLSTVANIAFISQIEKLRLCTTEEPNPDHAPVSSISKNVWKRDKTKGFGGSK